MSSSTAPPPSPSVSPSSPVPEVSGWPTEWERVSVSTSSEIFGSNSDGGMALSEWLDAMCLGCRHERAGDRPGIGGGSGCELVSRAICDPYTADMPEWTVRCFPGAGAGGGTG